jgi:hypothetical protein
MIKHTDINQLDDIVTYESYKLVGLFNKDGEALLPYNTPVSKEGFMKRWGQIKNRLLSAGLPQGTYEIRAKAFNKAAAVPDTFQVYKDSTTAPGQDNIKDQGAPGLNFPENIDIIWLRTEIVKLQYEIKFKDQEIDILNKKVLELNTYISEIEKELSEYETEKADTPAPIAEPAAAAGSQWTNIIVQALPVLDKWFEQKKEELELKKKEITLQENAQKRAFMFKQQFQKQQQSKEQNPDDKFIFESLSEIDNYLKAADLNQTETLEFFNKLSVDQPGLYKEAIQFINEVMPQQ